MSFFIGMYSLVDARGIQGTDGDLSMDHPGVHPANDEPFQCLPSFLTLFLRSFCLFLALFYFADAGGIQGTDGDLSIDHRGAHPANDEEVREAPPELPGAELRQYKHTILQLLQADETIPEALR